MGALERRDPVTTISTRRLLHRVDLVTARLAPDSRTPATAADPGVIGGPGSDSVVAESEQKGLDRAVRPAACGAHTTI
jgi:hypothetical protein